MLLWKLLFRLFIAVNVLAALFAAVGFASDALELSKPRVAAYCKIDGFVERSYDTFAECNQSLKSDIAKHGYICSCRRADGVFGLFTNITKHLL